MGYRLKDRVRIAKPSWPGQIAFRYCTRSGEFLASVPPPILYSVTGEAEAEMSLI